MLTLKKGFSRAFLISSWRQRKLSQSANVAIALCLHADDQLFCCHKTELIGSKGTVTGDYIAVHMDGPCNVGIEEMDPKLFEACGKKPAEAPRHVANVLVGPFVKGIGEDFHIKPFEEIIFRFFINGRSKKGRRSMAEGNQDLVFLHGPQKDAFDVEAER